MNTNCYLNRMHMKFNSPPPRLDLISPYIANSSLTKYDLDMRRKAEILKYEAKNTQSNSKLTKKQRFAKIVKTANGAKQAVCASQIIKTSSTSSGVPGKAIQLYLDPSVPLYNYTNSITRTFAEMENEYVLPWIFHAKTEDVVLSATGNYLTNIATLEISQAIVNPISSFIISSPFTCSSSITNMSVSLKIMFGCVENVYLNPQNHQIDYNINTTTKTITIKNIFLYTTSGFFYEFYLGVTGVSSAVTIVSSGTQITEINYVPN